MNDERLEAVAEALFLQDHPGLWWKQQIDVLQAKYRDKAAAALAAADQFGIDAALEGYSCVSVDELYTSSPNKWQAMIARSTEEWGADDQPVGFGTSPTAAILAACKSAKEAQR